MLCSAKELDGFALAARDGDIGHAREFYFDDERWVVRHVVADTSGWLPGRDVLISPHSIERIDPARRRIDVALSRRQIKDAPGIETGKPVSRQQEIPYYDHYGYPYYWTGSGLWGAGAYPLAGAPAVPPPGVAVARDEAETRPADAHLRSSNEVIGYSVEAIDGEIGHIDDFLFDDRSWQIRHAVVDTRNWLPGRKVLVSPQWIAGIDWGGRRARFKVTRAAVKSSPPYDRAALSEDDERRLQRHYEEER